MLPIHPQFAAGTPGNKLGLAGSEREEVLMEGSEVPERAFGAVLKGVYSEVDVLRSSNKGGVGEIGELNRGSGIME